MFPWNFKAQFLAIHAHVHVLYKSTKLYCFVVTVNLIVNVWISPGATFRILLTSTPQEQKSDWFPMYLTPSFSVIYYFLHLYKLCQLVGSHSTLSYLNCFQFPLEWLKFTSITWALFKKCWSGNLKTSEHTNVMYSTCTAVHNIHDFLYSSWFL